MRTILPLSGPLAEPVLLDEVKLHLRIDHNHEDSLLSACIVAARQACESYTRRGLITQTWQLYLDQWPIAAVHLPKPPIQSVNSIKIYGPADTETVIDPDHYQLVAGYLRRQNGVAWPHPGRIIGGIEITYTSGYGDSWNDVPMDLRQGLLMTIANLYENRTLVMGTALPKVVAALWQPYRVIRL